MHVIDDPSRFVKLMNMLAASYPMMALTKGNIRAYAEGLGGMPLDKIERAMGACVKENARFPSVAEIGERTNTLILEEGLKASQDTYHLGPLSEDQKEVNRKGVALCRAVLGAQPDQWQQVIDSWRWMEA